ncbi:MAG: hypothetical protein J6W69_06230, partial [Bacteroidales bacterium]|nr:hypothetical protein [Bacteroidales bacterium]
MNRQVLLALLLGLALNVFSQSDSAAFVHGPWLSEKVDGLVLHRCRFKDGSLVASNQQVLVWELAPTADFALRLAYRPERTKTSDMARKQHAVAAVNGSFFDMDRHHPVLFLRVDGMDVGQTSPDEAQLALDDYQYGTLAMDHDHVFILK